MIEFIICDDNKYVREINQKIIAKAVMPYEFNYKVHLFSKYTKELNDVITNNNSIKIYLLDIELPGKSGIEIAKIIRKYDWDSTIIFLTTHNELELKVLKQKLLIFDFVSKFDDYENNIIESINLVLKRLDNGKYISLKVNKEIYNIKVDDIIYIYRDTYNQLSKVVTNSKEYEVRKPLYEIAQTLGTKFVRTHRACFVNKTKIKHIDFNKNIIYLTSNKSINFLSRMYKKELEMI